MRLLNKIKNLILLKLKEINSINLSKTGKIGSNVKLKGAIISGSVTIAEGCKISHGVHLKGESEIIIGRFTSINGPMTDIHAMVYPVKIGAFSSIARNVSIQEYNHSSEKVSTYLIRKNVFKEGMIEDVESKGPIIIGNDVWIGAHSLVLSGSKIGDGAVIGANSVVNGEIPPYSIAVGSPAKVVKMRFDEDKINYLLSLKWWEWDLDKIKKNKDFFINKF
ncbi:CatB-related O-acetyltransferase [Shivajiella indica]|uniref:CatB-related O-acetyltransferase n=1 Tax=Shivajiella indica TaxID=872115 RepID=A0ABW5BEN1_9BACT